jgi:predicted nuclease with TOPRIM domain
MTATKVFVVDGQRFSAAVARPGPGLAPEQSGAVLTIDDPTLIALSILLHSLKGDEEKTCSSLIGKRVALNSQCATFLRQRQTKAQADMESSHETIKQECQAQLEHIESLKTRLSELQQDLNKADHAKGVAHANLQGARADLASLSRFAPKPKIHKMTEAVKAAAERVAELIPRETEIRQEWQRIELTELPRAHERMRELETQESQARAMLNGDSFTDEFGIVHPGRH